MPRYAESPTTAFVYPSSARRSCWLETSRAEPYLARAKRLDDVYNLINRVRKPNQENRVTDLTQLGQACEAASLVDEAHGWYSLAITRDPLDSDAQRGFYRLRNDAGGTGSFRSSESASERAGEIWGAA